MPARKSKVVAPVAEAVVEPTGISSALTVYEQLLACARMADANFAEFKATEPLEKFYDRLLRTVSDAPDEAWSALEKDGEAQTWHNAAVDATQASPPTAPASLPGLPVFAETAPAAKPMSAGAKKLAEINAKRKADKELREKAAQAGGAPAAQASKVKEAKPAKEPKAPKTPKEPKVKGERKVREHNPNGMVSQLKELVLNNRDKTPAELIVMAKAKNIGAGKELKMSTVATVKTDVMSTYNTMLRLGMVKA